MLATLFVAATVCLRLVVAKLVMNQRSLRSENTQTSSHGGQDIFEHGWLIDIIHYMLGCRFPPFSGINVYFIRDKKIRVQMLHHAVLVVVLLVLLRLALRLFVKSNNDGTPHVGYYSVCL